MHSLGAWIQPCLKATWYMNRYILFFGGGQNLDLCHLQSDSWNHTGPRASLTHVLWAFLNDHRFFSIPSVTAIPIAMLGLPPQPLHGPPPSTHLLLPHAFLGTAMHFPTEAWLVFHCPVAPGYKAKM